MKRVFKNVLKNVFKNIFFWVLIIIVSFAFACNKEKEPIPIEDPVVECEHEFEKVKTKAATCTEDGYQGYNRCVLCGYEEEHKVIKATGHDFVYIKGRPATLTEDGYTSYYECSRCGLTKDKEILYKLNHLHHGSLVSEVARTKESCAIQTYLCDECSQEYTVYDNALNWEEEFMDELRILFVGNSFTNYNCLIDLFKAMVESEGIHVTVAKFSYGGQYLYNYCEGENGTYHESLLKFMKNTKYDIVFLQEQSNNPATNSPNFYACTRELYDYFTGLGSTVVMYETWSYRQGYRGWSYYEMSQRLSAAYEAIADELGIKVSRAGTAFCYMYQKHNEIDLNKQGDGTHPTSLGTYLVALVHYATIYGRDPRGINYTYNDYIKNEDITWHGDTTRSEISVDLQKDLEDIAYLAAFGGSNVGIQYKTSSVGVTDRAGE